MYLNSGIIAVADRTAALSAFHTRLALTQQMLPVFSEFFIFLYLYLPYCITQLQPKTHQQDFPHILFHNILG